MSKHTVVLTKTVEVELEANVAKNKREVAAIIVAKCFLDHEEEDEEVKKEDLPMRVCTQYVGTVVDYGWTISVVK